MRFIYGLLALGLSMSAASAAGLECSRVTIISPYPPGGATDVAARLVAERMEALLKRSFIVENRPGATGNIGTAAVIASKPDGCTLLINAAVIATFPHSFAKLSYNPIKDLVPIGGVGITPTIISTASANPPRDLKGLIQWSKEKSEGLTFSTAGYGLLQHLAAEEIGQRSGSKFVHVVYKGGAQAATDLVTARVDFGSFAAGSVLPFVKDGKLRALAVIQDKRSALVPDVPTIAEQGMPGLNAGVHFMIYAPAGTPKDVVSQLNAELRKVVGDPTLKERFIAIGFDPTPISSEEAAAIMRRTSEDWAPIIKRLNIRLE